MDEKEGRIGKKEKKDGRKAGKKGRKKENTNGFKGTCSPGNVSVPSPSIPDLPPADSRPYPVIHFSELLLFFPPL